MQKRRAAARLARRHNWGVVMNALIYPTSDLAARRNSPSSAATAFMSTTITAANTWKAWLVFGVLH